MSRLVALGNLNGTVLYGVVDLSLSVPKDMGAVATASQLVVPLSLLLGVIFLGESI